MVRGEGRKNAKSGTFGTVHKLPSGRYRALYTGPDGRRHKAPTTFTAIVDARGWLSLQHADIIRKAWTPPSAEPAEKMSFAAYAETWLARRTKLKARTREHYRKLLDVRLLPTFGALPIGAINADDVTRWHKGQGTETPTYTAHAYSLLSTICGDAVKERLLITNPCILRGAGYAERATRIRPATLDELTTIVESMPESYRPMVILAAWCALRFGELTALTRDDVAFEWSETGEPVAGTLSVSKGVVLAGGVRSVTTPKSKAGDRNAARRAHLPGSERRVPCACDVLPLVLQSTRQSGASGSPIPRPTAYGCGPRGGDRGHAGRVDEPAWSRHPASRVEVSTRGRRRGPAGRWHAVRSG